jgi:hypothetical protein
MTKRTVRVQALSSASATTHATNNSHGGRAIEDDQPRNEDARHRVNEEPACFVSSYSCRNLGRLRITDAPSCQARAKRTGKRCRGAAVTGWRVCYHHGAGGGAPLGNENAGRGRHSAVLRQWLGQISLRTVRTC